MSSLLDQSASTKQSRSWHTAAGFWWQRVVVTTAQWSANSDRSATHTHIHTTNYWPLQSQCFHNINRIHPQHEMWTTATNAPTMLCVCQSVCNMPAPCKRHWMDWGLFGVKTLGPKEHCVRWVSRSPRVWKRKILGVGGEEIQCSHRQITLDTC